MNGLALQIVCCSKISAKLYLKKKNKIKSLGTSFNIKR